MLWSLSDPGHGHVALKQFAELAERNRRNRNMIIKPVVMTSGIRGSNNNLAITLSSNLGGKPFDLLIILLPHLVSGFGTSFEHAIMSVS